MFGKRAEMGIGTLIIFIALLLVAAIAAGVLIQTSGSLQEKALSTGDQAEGQIATNSRVIEVSATDGRAGELRNFTQIMKLAPGSEAIKLEQALLTINTFDRTATLHYAGTDSSLTNAYNGFYTIAPRNYSGGPSSWSMPTDLDEDDNQDSLSGGLNGANVTLTISNGTSSYTLSLGNCSSPDVTFADDDYVASSSLTCDGTNATHVYIIPRTSGSGTFAVEYLQTGSNWVDGNLQRGDVIKVYYEAPKNIGEDEYVRINFIPKIGTPTLTEFITPEVISEERIYLYP